MRVQTLENRWSQEQLITGVELPNWLRILKDNEFAVGREYLHRAAMITGMSVLTGALGALEDLRFARQLASVEVDPVPLFIIGHWRSGTTHLHNLLGRDPNHTYSRLYQVVFPGAFLSTGRLGPRILKNAIPDKRSYDNMSLDWFEAAEDEIALMKVHGMSFYTALMFPDQHARFEKYIDFLEATEAERQLWKTTFERFLKKMMLDSGGKRVVVKSCPHSARIRMLLDLFPDAKFVHIHRHPFRVFRSMVHMRSKVDWENFFHRPERAFVEQREEHTAVVGERVFRRIIEDRELIPSENLIEIAYHDLCGNELAVLERIYETFGLPDWDRYAQTIRPYVEGLRGYVPNQFAIDDATKAFVYDRWRLVFDTYGYDPENVQ